MKEINICNIRKCSSCIKKLDGSCSGCSLCDVAFCRCSKEKLSRCLVRCPRKLGTFNNIKIIKDDRILLGNSFYDLPGYIPIMPDRIKSDFDFTEVNNIIGVHGEFLLSANGENISPIYKMRGYKRTLNLSEDINGVLEFYIKDRALEGFWANRKELYKQLKKQNFKAIITPNFSLYEDAPRSEHLYNIQRAKRVYNEMIQEELPAILDIIWATNEDLEFWIKEINRSNRGLAGKMRISHVKSIYPAYTEGLKTFYIFNGLCNSLVSNSFKLKVYSPNIFMCSQPKGEI